MSMPTGNAQQDPADDASTTVGIGGRTSGQQGSTPTHESQQETGGNGGPGLTRNQSGPYVNAPDGSGKAQPSATDMSAAADSQADSRAGASVESLQLAQRAETVDAAMTHTNPGAQDTHSGQAGLRDTGLGTRETGGNHDEGDLPPVRP